MVLILHLALRPKRIGAFASSKRHVELAAMGGRAVTGTCDCGTIRRETDGVRARAAEGRADQQHARYLPMSAQFNIRAADPASVSLLESELGLPRFIAATLVARGIRTPHDAREFLNPSLERDWLDPYTIPGLPEVADALEEAMQRRQAHRRVRRLRPGRHIGHHGAHAGPAHAGRPCHAVHPAALRRRLRPDRGRVRRACRR